MKPSEAHLLAKRLIVQYIDNRLDYHGACIEHDNVIVKELQQLRNFIRNNCLWNNKWDSMDYNEVYDMLIGISSTKRGDPDES